MIIFPDRTDEENDLLQVNSISMNQSIEIFVCLGSITQTGGFTPALPIRYSECENVKRL